MAVAAQAQSDRLEYRVALDLATALVTAEMPGRGSSLLMDLSPFLVREALIRAPESTTVIAESADSWSSGSPQVPWLSVADYAGSNLIRLGDLAPEQPFGGAVWFSPERATWKRHLDQINRCLAVGGLLVLMTSGGLAEPLARFRQSAPTGQPDWIGSLLIRALQRDRFQVEASYRLGGFVSLVWAAVTRLAHVARREALADRTEAAYRSSLVTWRPIGVGLLSLHVARKTAW
jgi:hypothetical protein